jgi:hypothetical protein
MLIIPVKHGFRNGAVEIAIDHIDRLVSNPID